MGTDNFQPVPSKAASSKAASSKAAASATEGNSISTANTASKSKDGSATGVSGTQDSTPVPVVRAASSTPTVDEGEEDAAPRKMAKNGSNKGQARGVSPEWPTSPNGIPYEDELLDRVRTLDTVVDPTSNRYGFTKLPRGSTWGAEDDKLDDVFCSGDGRPLTMLLIGETEHLSFFNEIGQPLKFVRISVRPMYHADVVAAHRIIKQLAANVKKEDELQVGIVEAGRRQARREKKGRSTVAYEFRHTYDASDQYGPKSIMPKISIQDLGYRDLVLMECKIVRFRVNADTGKANYFAKSWSSWRVRFDIVSICRLNESGDDVDSDVPADDEAVPII